VFGSAFVLSRCLSLHIPYAGLVGVPKVRTNDRTCSALDESSRRFHAFFTLFQDVTQSAESWYNIYRNAVSNACRYLQFLVCLGSHDHSPEAVDVSSSMTTCQLLDYHIAR
jgi:hypothetical protein